MNLRNEKEPPAGMTSSGTPSLDGFCHDLLGCRWRSPEIPVSSCHWEGRLSAWYGRMLIFQLWNGRQSQYESDPRRYSSPHRETKRWKELYNERTSVERCNSRLKTHLTADAMHVWGIQKVTTHQYLNAIVLLASALAMARQSKPPLKILIQQKFCRSVHFVIQR